MLQMCVVNNKTIHGAMKDFNHWQIRSILPEFCPLNDNKTNLICKESNAVIALSLQTTQGNID